MARVIVAMMRKVVFSDCDHGPENAVTGTQTKSPAKPGLMEAMSQSIATAITSPAWQSGA
jgi:hypothetical protein